MSNKVKTLEATLEEIINIDESGLETINSSSTKTDVFLQLRNACEEAINKGPNEENLYKINHCLNQIDNPSEEIFNWAQEIEVARCSLAKQQKEQSEGEKNEDSPSVLEPHKELLESSDKTLVQAEENDVSSESETETIEVASLEEIKSAALTSNVHAVKNVPISGDDNHDEKTGLENANLGPIYEIYHEVELHHFTKMLPEASEEDYERIKANMTNGKQIVPAVMFKGRLADGRTRNMIRMELGRPLLVQDWLGTEEELGEHVESTNICHRHLKPSQMAATIVRRASETGLLKKLKDEAEKRQKEGVRAKLPEGLRARTILAEKYEVGERSLADALKIQKASPELLQKVFDGELSLGQAIKQLKAESLSKAQKPRKAKRYPPDIDAVKTFLKENNNAEDYQRLMELTNPKSKLHKFCRTELKALKEANAQEEQPQEQDSPDS